MKKYQLLLISSLVSLGLIACNGDMTESGDEYASEPEDQAEETMPEQRELPAARDIEVDMRGETQGDMATLLREIRTTAGSPRASSPEQCKVIGVGAKPCGGPERYIMYSTQEADEEKLIELVNEYNAMAKLRNEKEGMISDCQVVPEPAVILRNDVCVPAEQATR